ncbi:TPA: hypothetical protein ACJIVJ_001980 [Yersinia enterocolitica]
MRLYSATSQTSQRPATAISHSNSGSTRLQNQNDGVRVGLPSGHSSMVAIADRNRMTGSATHQRRQRAR